MSFGVPADIVEVLFPWLVVQMEVSHDIVKGGLLGLYNRFDAEMQRSCFHLSPLECFNAPRFDFWLAMVVVFKVFLCKRLFLAVEILLTHESNRFVHLRLIFDLKEQLVDRLLRALLLFGAVVVCLIRFLWLGFAALRHLDDVALDE